MTVSALPRTLAVEQLRSQMQQMQDGVPRVPVATPAGLRPLLQLRTGGSYRVDDLSLAFTMLAAPSQEGSWVGVVGVDDFGVEAADEYGVDLSRTIVVPDPAESWLEVVAALVDVLPVVFLRSPRGVNERTAQRLGARLRKRSSVLLVQGHWPGAEARLRLSSTQWSGLGAGHGRLTSRHATVACKRGTAPEMFADLVWPPGRLSSAEGAYRNQRDEVLVG